MVNKEQNFFAKNWHWLIFFGLVFFGLVYLIFARGVWAFADSGFYYQNILQTQKIAFSKLGQFANTDGFYFGYDNSASSYSHLIISFYQLLLTTIFGSDLGQIIYYFVYYLLCFYFGLKLLAKLFPTANKNDLKIGALFLTFNPFSLLVITLFTVGYIYAFFIAFLYVFLNYLSGGKIKDLFLAVFFGLGLVSYLRLMPIIALAFLIIIWIFYDQVKLNLKRLIIFILLFTICASPFIVGNFLSLSNSNNIVSNYKESFTKYEQANYQFKKSFINSLAYPGGFTPSTLSFYYNNRGIPGFADNYAVKNSFEFYKFIQMLFNTLLLLLALLLIREKRSLKIFFAICFILFLNTLANFFGFDFFVQVNKSLLVFLYNDYGFLQLIVSFLLTFILVILFGHFRKKFKNFNLNAIAFFVVISYLTLNLTPLLSNHYGLKKINQIPDDYKQMLFASVDYNLTEATIFAPYHWLKFSWSPYFLDLNNFTYSKYKSLLVPNLRIVDSQLADFYNQVYDNFDKETFGNLAIFNIKNIFVFNDVTDANKNIDAYQVFNIENTSAKISQQLKLRNDFKNYKEYPNFTHYRFNDADSYDFFIYSPAKIISLNLANFYETKINLKDKPLIFNKSELNEVNLTDEKVWLENNLEVEVKSYTNNSNKYLIKLSGVNKNLPFLLQFNQMYSPFWRIYFVDQDEWNKVECLRWEKFKITKNSRCATNGLALSYTDLNLIGQDSLNPKNHFKGNIIGNAFLVLPQDIPVKYQSGQELYLVIYFEKQFYYLISLTVSLITFFGLLIFALVEIFKQKKRHEK